MKLSRCCVFVLSACTVSQLDLICPFCAWGNTHEPQAGVDVTNEPAERQTQTLRRHSDPITPLRLRHVDDDGSNEEEEETPDNATTDDEDDHADTEKYR